MPRASVIIPTFNRSTYLGTVIFSLAAQGAECNDYEILVVDNGSTDDTREVAQRAIAKYPGHRIRYLYEPEPGLLSGRHLGVKEAEGEVLICVDDDIEAKPGWLWAIVEAFEDPTVQLVGGRNLPKYEVSPPSWLEGFWSPTPYGGRMCGWLSLLDLGDSPREIHPNYVWGLNFAIRREALFALGGFHPDCISDELQHFQGDGETGLTTKAHKQGYKAVYEPKATVCHLVPAGRLTTEYFERRAYYQGVCDSYSALRREGSEIAIESPVPSMLDRTRSVSAWALRYTKRLAKRLILSELRRNPPHGEDPGVEAIKERTRRAYQAGYEFHQKAVRESPELRAWVLRPDYWDYRLPLLDLPEAGTRTDIRAFV